MNCCSVSKSCLTLYDPIDCITSAFSDLHYLPEFAQTHVHCGSDAMQPSHPLSPPSPLALSLPQHHGLFQWVSSSHQEAKVLKFQLHHQSFHWRFRVDFHWDWLVWSPCSPRDYQDSSPALQFRSINSSVLNFLYDPTLTSIYDYWKSHTFDYMDLCQLSDISAFI